MAFHSQEEACWEAGSVAGVCAVPCRTRRGVSPSRRGLLAFFLPAKPGFSTGSEEFCAGTPQMSKGCRKRILGLVRADFLPSKYTSGCESCGLSQ